METSSFVKLYLPVQHCLQEWYFLHVCSDGLHHLTMQFWLIANFIRAAEMWSEESIGIKMIVFPSYFLCKSDS